MVDNEALVEGEGVGAAGFFVDVVEEVPAEEDDDDELEDLAEVEGVEEGGALLRFMIREGVFCSLIFNERDRPSNNTIQMSSQSRQMRQSRQQHNTKQYNTKQTIQYN